MPQCHNEEVCYSKQAKINTLVCVGEQHSALMKHTHTTLTVNFDLHGAALLSHIVAGCALVDARTLSAQVS